MASIEIFTGNIADSACKAIIKNTCLPGGEEELAVLEQLEADFTADGPEWTEENIAKGKDLYDCYLAILSEAAARGTEEVDFAAIPAEECKSDLFGAATQAMRAIKEHQTGSDLPKVIRFVCRQDEVTNMYKTAYNYWLAIDHDSRMEVPHHD